MAISEMRHLRVLNGLLFELARRPGAGGPFAPALGVATLIPGAAGHPVARCASGP